MIEYRLSPAMMKLLRNFDWDRFRDQFPKGHPYGHPFESEKAQLLGSAETAK